MNINCNEVKNVGPTILINVTLIFTRKNMKTVKKYFCFSSFFSTNKTLHLKLVQREIKLGHLLHEHFSLHATDLKEADM